MSLTAPRASCMKDPEERKRRREQKKARSKGAAGEGTGEPDGDDKDESSASAQQDKSISPNGHAFFVRTGKYAAQRQNADMSVLVEGIMLYGGTEELLSNSTLSLNFGAKYGLVGRNGTGKSTLLRAISQRAISIPSFLHVVHVEQESEKLDTPALDSVLQADGEREWLLARERSMVQNETDEEEDVTLQEVYERLEELESDSAEHRAATILAGLGFSREMMQTPTKSFSGGWRMRISLAQALFLQPDVLLLDEPTNHLDVHALTWLEEFLSKWDKTVIIVSHDRGFLNRVTEYTIFMHRKRLRYYRGNYDTFLRVRADHMANQEAVRKQQERRAQQIKNFINTAGVHKKAAKQAQSRMKLLEKIRNDMVDVDTDDPSLKLQFPSSDPLPPPVISVMDAAFEYEPGKPLYKNLELGVDCESRIAVVGPNGAGKTTFLKLLEGELIPTEGWVSRHTKLRIAKFTQHHLEMMNPEESAVDHMRKLEHEMPVETARKYLGQFGLQGENALKPVRLLSGGQRSRLAFSQLAWKQPHILLLDEPTNHLDLETIESLAFALNDFGGGVVLVSHDERLISLVCDEIWSVNPGNPGSVSIYHGSFADYKADVQKTLESKQLT